VRTLALLKKDLEFNSGLASLIEVLKNIAVSQFRALENRLKRYEEFSEAVSDFFEGIDIQNTRHPFVVPRSQTQIVVAVTSDRGLLGGLNMRVVSAAIRELEKMPGRLIVVGDKGKAYAKETGLPFTSFGGVTEEDRLPQALQLRDYIIKEFSEANAGFVKMVYPYPVSFTFQRPEIVSFIPFAYKAQEQTVVSKPSEDIVFESSLDDIIAYLVYLWMGHKIFEIFGLSRLAEFAARFVHLEESAQRLKEEDMKLKRAYFRVRHELIDRGMRELFSARLLYAS
jgi:ATP synthase F1 gamma subunit